MLLSEGKNETFESTKLENLQRRPLLVVSLLALLGGTLIYLVALRAIWYLSWTYGILFTVLGVIQVGSFIAVLARPSRRRVLIAAVVALLIAGLWNFQQNTRFLPSPNPWTALNSTIGFAGVLCAAWQVIAAFGLFLSVWLGPRRNWRRVWRLLVTLALVPLVVVVLLSSAVGVIGSSDGFTGASFPFNAAAPAHLPAGQMSTVEYCRPDGIPLAMDLYMPPASVSTGQPAPVILYVHGGGPLGNRKMTGAGASLANHQGALFTPLQQGLNARGFVVAAVDHRLPPGTPWPAQIEDAKCAVRFLRAHAADLGIDPERVGVWGSSGGGHLALMLGLTGPEAGFDQGQYLDQSSAVQAVVDMFGVTDLNDMNDASPFNHFILRISIGDSENMRYSASPINYVAPGDPPFLIFHGAEDKEVPPRQSIRLAEKLRAAGVPDSLIEVQGAGHGLNSVDQRPFPQELTAKVIDFFETELK